MLVRPARAADLDFIADMLVAAANWRPGPGLPRAEILATPSLAHYVDGWMRPTDLGVVALSAGGAPLGAAWLRYFTAADPGYRYVRDDIPELSIGVVKAGVWAGRCCGRYSRRHGRPASRPCPWVWSVRTPPPACMRPRASRWSRRRPTPTRCWPTYPLVDSRTLPM